MSEPLPLDPLDPRSILRQLGHRPRKGLGQHFLVDRSYVASIIDAADVSGTDIVLEIGPGLGTLTMALADRGAHVIAVEIDPDVVRILSDRIGQRDNVRLLCGDILAWDPGALVESVCRAAGPRPWYKVVANLPYYITSADLRHLLSAPTRPELTVVMVQAEVADRILASPPEMSILSVSVQFYCRPRRIADVPAAAFYPVPKVDSAVIRLDAHAEPPVALPAGGEAAFFRVVRAGFGQRRKQLKNSLAAGLTIERDAAAAALARCGIDPRRRAETLSLAEWSELAKALGMQAIAGRHDRSPGAPDDPAARRSR